MVRIAYAAIVGARARGPRPRSGSERLASGKRSAYGTAEFITPTNLPAPPRAPSYIERGEEPERVVGESYLFAAEGGPKLQHLVEGNAEDELDVGLGGLIEQRRQDQPNAPGPVAER
jgi:hypothetical protein